MKSNNTYPRNDRRRYGNSLAKYTRREPRPNQFEIQLNRFFYRAFGGLSLFILFAVIYTGAWHHLITVGLTAIVAWVIYDGNKKHKR